MKLSKCITLSCFFFFFHHQPVVVCVSEIKQKCKKKVTSGWNLSKYGWCLGLPFASWKKTLRWHTGMEFLQRCKNEREDLVHIPQCTVECIAILRCFDISSDYTWCSCRLLQGEASAGFRPKGFSDVLRLLPVSLTFLFYSSSPFFVFCFFCFLFPPYVWHIIFSMRLQAYSSFWGPGCVMWSCKMSQSGSQSATCTVAVFLVLSYLVIVNMKINLGCNCVGLLAPGSCCIPLNY